MPGRATQAADCRFLLTGALSKLLYPAVNAARFGTAENRLYAIRLRLLQTARSIEQSCYAGYAHEQQALVRTMVSFVA